MKFRSDVYNKIYHPDPEVQPMNNAGLVKPIGSETDTASAEEAADYTQTAETAIGETVNEPEEEEFENAGISETDV